MASYESKKESLLLKKMAFVMDHVRAGSVTRLRKSRYATVLLLLLYSVTANVAVVFGGMCCSGAHFGEGSHSDASHGHSSRLHEHDPECAAIGPGEAAFAGHCCAGSSSPHLKRGLSEHVGSYKDRSDPTSLSDHESSFIEELGAALTRPGHFFDPCLCEGNPELVCLSTVVLLI